MTPSSEQDTAPSTQEEPKLGPGGISFTIWPPTQRTRDAVISRLIETLSTPSVLSKRYGTLPSDEASAAARQIEDEAFAAAGGSSATDSDDIKILQVYSKEISKRMLDTVKARAATPAAVENGAGQTPTSDVPPSSSLAEEAAPAAADSDT
ncbi:WPP domain [Sesbania bispinosa]|nr:WPP domain [Sesbania bispinosa]